MRISDASIQGRRIAPFAAGLRAGRTVELALLALVFLSGTALAQDAILRPPGLIPPPAILSDPADEEGMVESLPLRAAPPAGGLSGPSGTAPLPAPPAAARALPSAPTDLSAPSLVPAPGLGGGLASPILSMPAARPPASFKSETEAFMVGLRSYQSGDKVAAVRALEFAATKGHPRALWKLGKMYADGDGVDHDDLKAFEFFSRIADSYADEAPGTPNASFVANAFVTLGSYFMVGIPGSYVKPNPHRGREMFQYAASYFGDPAAQFHLGQVYLDGLGTEKDPRQAARWLKLSADKGHNGAQALLGHMLIAGHGVPRQSARGLMWLTLARDAADPVKDAWIVDMHEKAFAAATDTDRQAALSYLERHLRQRP